MRPPSRLHAGLAALALCACGADGQARALISASCRFAARCHGAQAGDCERQSLQQLGPVAEENACATTRGGGLGGEVTGGFFLQTPIGICGSSTCAGCCSPHAPALDVCKRLCGGTKLDADAVSACIAALDGATCAAQGTCLAGHANEACGSGGADCVTCSPGTSCSTSAPLCR